MRKIDFWVMIPVFLFCLFYITGCVMDFSVDETTKKMDTENVQPQSDTATSSSLSNNDNQIVIKEKWDCFYILDKPALYAMCETDIVIDDSDLLFRTNEKGQWILWCFYGDEWLINDVWNIYSINSVEDISSISVNFKNAKDKSGFLFTDNTIKSSVMAMMNDCTIISRETWCINHSLLAKEENDSKTVLYIDINLSSGLPLSLQLYPYADCLVQNGECIFQLPTGIGEELFNLLTNMSTSDFKENISNDKE